jgi:hypothetical protein
MDRTHRIFPLALIVALAAVALVAVTAQAASLPKLLTYNGAKASGLKLKPKSITLTADGSDIIGNGKNGLKWSAWTATGATGSGSQYINNCNPNCAGGKTTAYPVTLKASSAKTLHGVLAFNTLTVSYTGKLPAKTRRTWSLKLTFASGTFGWQ